jgi:hypothetical protein
LEALWPQLGNPSLDPQTVDLLTKQAGVAIASICARLRRLANDGIPPSGFTCRSTVASRWQSSSAASAVE